MVKKLKYSEGLLFNLMKLLVSEWGYSAVMGTLLNFEKNGVLVQSDNKISIRVDPRESSITDGRSSKLSKLLADDEISAERKSLLLEIMNNFENKKFLPRIPDVRNFLEMYGYTQEGFKQRQGALRIVFEALKREPDDNLRRIIKLSFSSGPSELGPLSDAIKATGREFRAVSSHDSKNTMLDDNYKNGEGENNSGLKDFENISVASRNKDNDKFDSDSHLLSPVGSTPSNSDDQLKNANDFVESSDRIDSGEKLKNEKKI